MAGSQQLAGSATWLPVVIEAAKVIGSAAVGTFFGLLLARRKLHVSLVSLKPSALEGLVGYSCNVTPPLLQNLKDFHWSATSGRDFQEIEDLAVLNDQLKVTRLFLKAADRCKQPLDSAIATLTGGMADPTRLRELLSDICSYHVIMRLLSGIAKRHEIALDPLPKDIAAVPTIVPFSDEQIGAGFKGVTGRVILEFNSYATTFPYDDPMAREAMLRMGFALAKGDAPKLLAILQKTRERLLTDMACGTNIATQLEILVHEHSRWTANVQLTNHGQTPIILSTQAELTPKCGRKRYPSICFDVVSKPRTRKVSSDGDDISETESALRAFGVTPDITADTRAEHLFVKPGDSISVVFVSTASIKDLSSGVELLDLWKKRLPSYRFHVCPVPRSIRILKSVSSRRTYF